MNEIQIFNNPEFGDIRTLVDENNEPLFMAADVCGALGYANPRDAIRKHVEKDDVAKCDTIDNMGREQTVNVINESGLYALIFGSTLPQAKQFKKWVTSEVLPAIRKSGGYIVATSDDDAEAIMARALVVAHETLDRIKRQNEEQRNIITVQTEQIKTLTAACDEMRPKVSYYDAILASPTTCTTTSIAMDYGMSAIRFNKMLHEKKIQRKVDGQWIPYAPYLSAGYAHSEPITIETGHGTKVKYNTKWTVKGRLFIYDLLKKHDILPLIEQNT